MMINKRLLKAADRSFRLFGAMLMRSAIARLPRVDDGHLSQVGLSRAAVGEFLASPLRTDPHRFFARHVALQVGSQGIGGTAPNALPPALGSRADRDADGSITAGRDVVLVGISHLGAVLIAIRQMAGLRIRLLALGVLGGLAALGTCAGPAADSKADIRRDPTTRCRLRPDSFPYPAPPAPMAGRAAVERSAVAHPVRHRAWPETRDGPPAEAADDLQHTTF
ncbi:MAG: hypothetical protein ABWY18_01290 [Tardiphaga sp.]